MQIEQVKRNINKMIVYKDKADIYKLTACILRKNKDGFFYQAELSDTKHGRSVIICKLEEVGVIE